MSSSGAGSPNQRPRVRSFIRVYPTNSQAALVETDQGEYVIKAVNNPDGPPVLIADWVGSKAARWLGVPVPDCCIVDLSDVVEVPLDKSGSRFAEPGPCFGSKFMRGYGWDGDPGSLQEIENPEDVSGIMVVDTWLRNVDRFVRNTDGTVRENPGNLFLQTEGIAKGRFRLVAIDFGHAFGGPSWNARQLTGISSVRDNTKYGLFPVFNPYMKRAYLAPFLERLAGVTEDDTRSFLDGLPKEWGLRTNDGAAIAKFLQRRGRYVAEMLDKIVREGDSLWESC